jgi:hypothetical protein
MRARINAMKRPQALVSFGAALTLVGTVPMAPSGAEPATVGTAVNVVIATSFDQTADADQCVGASTLAAVRRGSSVILLEESTSPDAPKVAVGQFFRSRLKDGVCQALYITSAPVMAGFNVQFVGPDGGLSSVFGPNPAEPVSDQPGIQQVVHIDIGIEPQR